MAEGDYELILSDLTEIDRRALNREIPQTMLTIDEPEVPEGTHAELVTLTAVIVISLASITGLTAFLLKGRKKRKIRLRIRSRPDGSTEEVELEVDQNESLPPEQQVLQALANAMKVPISALASGAEGA